MTQTVNMPAICRQEETTASGEWYLILSDKTNRWSKTTGVHATIEQCYAEARQIVAKQFRIQPDATIRDYHGTWPV